MQLYTYPIAIQREGRKYFVDGEYFQGSRASERASRKQK